MYSLFIAYENDEWCCFVVRIAIDLPSLISFYCLRFASFYFSFLFFFFFLREVIEGSLKICKIKQLSCSQVPKFQKQSLTCSSKKVSREILQNSQKNTCARVSMLITLQAQACNFIKKDRLLYRISLVAASGVSRSELIQLPLGIEITVFVEPTEPDSAWEKFQLILPPLAS